MATRNPVNTPVEGTVVYPLIYKVFSTIQGGWEWDFWTINSINQNQTHHEKSPHLV